MWPASFPPTDLELQLDLPFSNYGLKLDVLRPRQRSPQTVPAIVHLHGGAWIKFSKWPVANVFLARAGFVTVSVDYRLAPGAIFPTQLHDAKTAVRWLQAHAEELGRWRQDRGLGHQYRCSSLGTTAQRAELE